ncbi:retrovirus-related Pol polyprotein from transposon 17.6 [Trichonephila clavata]|uniref:Retrovirus-related Pol polyprotein from transposon 17.6 n=1 Tax=Trichonephila clavata TaxID=2740835 RepID=A0A8X6GKE1_TRICU|nr:retrovirus-related Pol polyprotein from transposon 17.6 [Trichonephila clavata]
MCAHAVGLTKTIFWENVFGSSLLDDVCHCLPLAKIKIKTKGGEFYTKAAIKSNSRADEPYLLGNRTADLIEPSEKGVQMINAVVTRSASKEIGTSFNTANGSPIENPDQIPPPKVHEEKILEIPQFDRMKGLWLANVTSSDFRSEQEKCPDLQVLWEKARSGVDREFQIMKGKLVRVTRSKRGDEIRQLCVPLKFRLEINRLSHDEIGGHLGVTKTKDRVLRHTVGSGSRSPSDVKIKAIKDFPLPTTKTQGRTFLRIVGYAHYIPNYSEIASPLTDALKGKIKKEAIAWDERCEKAFEELKSKLVLKPILFCP